MNISTRQIRAFLLVHQFGSFTRAAEELSITQAGLSALVKELESQLGFRLFERTTRRVTTTSEGERLLPVVRRLATSLDEAIRDISAEYAQERRTIRVAASPVMMTGVFPEVLRQHLAAYPGDVIELLDVPRNQVLTEVEKGNADMGMGIFFRALSRIRQYRLFSSTLLLVSPADWTPGDLADDASIRLEHIPVDHLIKLPQDNPLQQWVDNRLASIGCLPDGQRRTLRLQNLESSIALVEYGQGHCIVPDFVLPVCQRYAVACRTIVSGQVNVDFHAIIRAGVEPGGIAADFIESFLGVVVQKQIGRKHVAPTTLRKRLRPFSPSG